MKTDMDETGAYGVMPESATVIIERLLPGPIDRLWSYLTDPAKRRLWLAGGPMELRPGGAVRLVFHNAELTTSDDPPPPSFAAMAGELTTIGSVTVCDPPSCLAFTWDADSDGGGSEVRFDLEPEGNRVRLTVTHRRLVQRGMLINVASGWHTHLAVLESLIEQRRPPAFWRTFSRLSAAYEERLPRD